MHILLVEDDSMVAESFINASEIRDWHITWVETIAAARVELELDAQGATEPPLSVGIFDLNLPDGLGVMLLPCDLPACIYSGLPDDAEMAMARAEVPAVPIFSKGDPFALFDWLQKQAE